MPDNPATLGSAGMLSRETGLHDKDVTHFAMKNIWGLALVHDAVRSLLFLIAIFLYSTARRRLKACLSQKA